MTQKQLEVYLWGAANILRGMIDAADFKQYIFPLLFFKRISDVWDEEYEQKTAHEFALKIINLTQYKEYLGFRYNYQTQTVDINREATFIPNLSYKIEF